MCVGPHLGGGEGIAGVGFAGWGLCEHFVEEHVENRVIFNHGLEFDEHGMEGFGVLVDVADEVEKPCS